VGRPFRADAQVMGASRLVRRCTWAFARWLWEGPAELEARGVLLADPLQPSWWRLRSRQTPVRWLCQHRELYGSRWQSEVLGSSTRIAIGACAALFSCFGRQRLAPAGWGHRRGTGLVNAAWCSQGHVIVRAFLCADGFGCNRTVQLAEVFFSAADQADLRGLAVRGLQENSFGGS